MEVYEPKYKDGLTAKHFIDLRTYLAKKEKVAANQEANRQRVAKLREANANEDLQEMSRDDSKEKSTTGKGEANAIRYSKERSHCLEANRYIVPRKVQAEKLPEHIKDMMVIDEDNINDEQFIERNCEMHENYMANLREIREGIERDEKEKQER